MLSHCNLKVNAKKSSEGTECRPMQGNPRQSWVQDSTEWILDSRYWIPVFVSRTWILGSNHQWDSGFLGLYSAFQHQGFWIPWAKFSQILGSLTWGEEGFTEQEIVKMYYSLLLSAVNYKSPKVRRLSTVSSVVAAVGHVYSTRWHWYWQDENNKWQSYDTPTDGHEVNTTSSQCLEREYTAGMKLPSPVIFLLKSVRYVSYRFQTFCPTWG